MKFCFLLCILFFGSFATLTSCGPSDCVGDSCIEIISGFYSREPNANGVGTSTYASVYFTFTEKGFSIGNLTTNNMSMIVNGRDTREEGGKRLTLSNGLIVNLLLDRSFSITKSGSEEAVRSSALSFINSLPNEGRVGIGFFASETAVPIFTDLDDNTSTVTSNLYSKESAAIIAAKYKAYDSEISEAQTRLYDATAHMCEFTPESSALKRLQSVMVVFTDGRDTASKYSRSAKDVWYWCKKENPKLRIYTIGLGSDIDESALRTISDGRFFPSCQFLLFESGFRFSF